MQVRARMRGVGADLEPGRDVVGLVDRQRVVGYHGSHLRASSIVQSAPRTTTASLHAAGTSIEVDGTPESRMTCPLHAVGSRLTDERAATTGVPPSIDCSICTEPSA